MKFQFKPLKSFWILIGVMLVALVGCHESPDPNSTLDEQLEFLGYTEEAETNEPPVRTLTMADFEALLYDMTYVNARDALGRECDEVEKEYVRGTGPYERTELRIWRTWRNPDNSAIKVSFVSDRLREKIPVDLEEVEEGY